MIATPSAAMRVKTRFVGLPELPQMQWPTGWPAPQVGDPVHLPGNDVLEVLTVAWYPLGEDDPEPFVYVVIGRPRR